MLTPNVRDKLRFIGTILLLVTLSITPLLNPIKISSAEAVPVTILTPKWSRSSLGNNWEGGMVIGNVDSDANEEIVYAGGQGATARISVLDGQTGVIKYTWYNSRISQYTQPQLNDIDNDGRLEILVGLYYRPGLLVLQVNAQNTALEQVWLRDVQGPTGSGSIMSKPIAADINGDGYSEIFVPSQDIEPNGGFDGTLTLFNYLGNIMAQTFTWRSCSGGVSIADTDKDGHYELYMGDRNEYMGDGDYGKGVRSFWAENLTQRWNNPTFLCSSQAPVLADVNNDGILDVIVSDQRGGVMVLNSTTGAFIWAGSKSTFPSPYNTFGMPVHYQLTVYDIDADGHLEVLMNDGDHSWSHNYPPRPGRTVGGYPDDMYVLDLVTHQVDKVISLSGRPLYNTTNAAIFNSTYNGYLAWNNKFSPLVADIYENGVNADGSPRMEIITGANTTRIGSTGGRSYPASLLIYDNDYQLLQNVTGLAAQIAYPFVQDIDNDGMLEVIIQNSQGNVRAYDTVKSEPPQRIRSEFTFFSERRMGAAVYIPNAWVGDAGPLVEPVYPGSDALAIPRSLPSLRFSLTNHQGNLMSYTLTSSIPGFGLRRGTNVGGGTYTAAVNGTSLPLQPYTVYTWTIKAYDGTSWTNRTYSFRTSFASLSGGAPTQGLPTLVSQGGGNSPGSTFIANNQSTGDPNGDQVVNLYKWYVNNVPINSLLMPFNTRNDTTVTDYSGNGNTGVVHGATWISDGKVGGAFSFDGDNDFISISDGGKGYYNNHTDAQNTAEGYPLYHPSLGGNGRWNEITVEHWIRLSAPSGTDGSWRTIAKAPSYEIGFRQNSNPNFNNIFGTIWVWKLDNTTATPRFTSDTRYTANNANASLAVGIWYHVVLTYKSNDGVRLYINGVLNASRLHTPTSPVNGSVMRSSGEPVLIGTGAGGYFEGSIDEVSIYPRALSAEQVMNRYDESNDGTSESSLLVPAGVGATLTNTLKVDVIPSDSQFDGPTRTSSSIVLNPGSIYTLTVPVVGSGSVAKNPDLSTYAYGANVILTATPTVGWTFTGWSGDASGSLSPTTVSMTSNKVVTATFSPMSTYDLTIGAVGSGTTSPAPGIYSYLQGTVILVDALPASGQVLSYWLLNGSNVGSADPYPVTVDQNRNLTAVFAAAPTSIFQDSFESGSTAAWDSATASSGESVAVISGQGYAGAYGLRSMGGSGTGTEYARVIEAFSPTLNEVYVRGYFKLTQNGIDSTDRIKLIELRAGITIVAAAGLRMTSGTLRWWMETRSGTTYVETYTTQIGSLNLAQWFSVELRWKLGAADGGGTLWVNGNQIYQITNADTDNYNSFSALRLGLAEMTNCGPTTLYSDSVVVSTSYIGP